MRHITKKTVPYIVLGLICILLIAGCPGGGGDGGSDTNDTDTGSNIKTKTYLGTADIIID